MAQKAKDIVLDYLEERPMLFVYALEGIININALARRIKQESKSTKTEESFIMALHRVLNDTKQVKVSSDSKVKEFLEKTTANIYGGYAVAVFEGKKEVDAEVVIKFGNNTVSIGNLKNLSKYKENAGAFIGDLAVIELVHPEGAENIKGLVFTIYWKLYAKGINIVETFSILNKTYILIEKGDIGKAVELFI